LKPEQINQYKIQETDRKNLQYFLYWINWVSRPPMTTFACPRLQTQRNIATLFISFIALATAETASLLYFQVQVGKHTHLSCNGVFCEHFIFRQGEKKNKESGNLH